jgi:hypothetical protein
MKQQTAVEWLVKEFNLEEFKATIEFAKAKEKEQIIKAHYVGGCYFHESRDCRDAEVPYINDAEDYYNQTYNKIK